MTRYALIGAGLALALFCIWHAAPRAPQTSAPAAAAALPAAGDPAASAAAPRRRRATAGFPAGPEGDAVVYVVGAVRTPGLYRLRPGSRADDAVRAAGGFTAGADPEGVNLAERVADGQEIVVPRTGQGRAPARLRGSRGSRPRASPPPEASVDVNAASAAELARVPGIGRALAARIVELRENAGAYASLDELLDVSGMTPARLERARPFLHPP